MTPRPYSVSRADARVAQIPDESFVRTHGDPDYADDLCVCNNEAQRCSYCQSEFDAKNIEGARQQRVDAQFALETPQTITRAQTNVRAAEGGR